MSEDIGITMPGEASAVRNFHAAQNQFSPNGEGMNIIPNPNKYHGQRLDGDFAA